VIPINQGLARRAVRAGQGLEERLGLSRA